MPFLHPQKSDAAFPVGARRLSPGASVCRAPAFFHPANYSCSEKEADSLLRDFQNLDLTSLESMRAQLNQANVTDALRTRDELAGIAAFRGEKTDQDINILLAREAQKTLLWLWHMETCIFDIASLEQQCDAEVARLHEQFSENAGSCMERHVDAVPDFSVYPWRAALACACRFIDAGTPIMLEQPAFSTVQDFVAFTEGVISGISPKMRILQAVAPLWRVLGHSQPIDDVHLRAIYNVERTWLGVSDD